MQSGMRTPINAENTKRDKRETSQRKAESVSIRSLIVTPSQQIPFLSHSYNKIMVLLRRK